MEYLVLFNTLVLIVTGSLLMYTLSSKTRNRVQNPQKNEK